LDYGNYLTEGQITSSYEESIVGKTEWRQNAGKKKAYYKVSLVSNYGAIHLDQKG